MAEVPAFVFREQTPDANRYATVVEGRELIVSFPRILEHTDPGVAVWTAYWADERHAGIDRSFTGEVRFKHHITTYEVEGVIAFAAGCAPAALPGVER